MPECARDDEIRSTRLDRSVRRHGRQAHGREEATHKRDEDDE